VVWDAHAECGEMKYLILMVRPGILLFPVYISHELVVYVHKRSARSYLKTVGVMESPRSYREFVLGYRSRADTMPLWYSILDGMNL